MNDDFSELDKKVFGIEKDISQIRKDIDGVGRKIISNEKTDRQIRDDIENYKNQLKGASNVWKVLTISFGIAIGAYKGWNILVQLLK